MNRRLEWHKKEVEEVIKLLLSCKTAGEIEEVFDRILTPREINDIARRYQALLLLQQGKSYLDIKQETKLSNSTIARISGKIGYGFRKTVQEEKPQEEKEWKPPRREIKYKGVPTGFYKK